MKLTRSLLAATGVTCLAVAGAATLGDTTRVVEDDVQLASLDLIPDLGGILDPLEGLGSSEVMQGSSDPGSAGMLEGSSAMPGSAPLSSDLEGVGSSGLLTGSSDTGSEGMLTGSQGVLGGSAELPDDLLGGSAPIGSADMLAGSAEVGSAGMLEGSVGPMEGSVALSSDFPTGSLDGLGTSLENAGGGLGQLLTGSGEAASGSVENIGDLTGSLADDGLVGAVTGSVEGSTENLETLTGSLADGALAGALEGVTGSLTGVAGSLTGESGSIGNAVGAVTGSFEDTTFLLNWGSLADIVELDGSLMTGVGSVSTASEAGAGTSLQNLGSANEGSAIIGGSVRGSLTDGATSSDWIGTNSLGNLAGALGSLAGLSSDS